MQYNLISRLIAKNNKKENNGVKVGRRVTAKSLNFKMANKIE